MWGLLKKVSVLLEVSKLQKLPKNNIDKKLSDGRNVNNIKPPALKNFYDADIGIGGNKTFTTN